VATAEGPERLVVLSGTSGTDVSRVLSFAEKELGVATAKFEDYVEDAFRAPIYHVAELLLVSYTAAAEKFRRAYEAMVRNLSGAREAVIGAHLAYYRRSNVVISPLVESLIRLTSRGAKVAVIDYVDDFYHILYRLAERVTRGRTPEVTGFQVLDPAGLLYWRSTHHSIVQLLSLHGVETVVYASKHSGAGHARLIAKLLGRRTEDGKRYETVYVSHPITRVREKAAKEGVPLSRHPDALDIEEFKKMLEERCPHIVVYSPTTIDELIPGEQGEPLATKITREKRWPHFDNGIHAYPYPVDLASSLFDKTIYPVDRTIGNPGYLEFLKAEIEASIERRDLGYVAQADYIVAYRPTMYGQQHMGVETEIKTAIATAKPVYSIIPPEERSISYTLFRFEYPLSSLDELVNVLHC
jgi:hypothetical protein